MFRAAPCRFRDILYMYRIAKILRSDNTDGGVLVSGETDLSVLDRGKPVYIEFEGLQTPFFILDCAPKGSRYLLHLSGVTSLKDAEELVGASILTDSAPEDEEDSFIGWTVFDGGAAATFGHSAAPLEVGTVVGDEPIPGNYCLRVRPTGGGREILLPLHEDLILSADRGSRELLLDLPEGLY